MGDKIKALFAVTGRANRLLYWKRIIFGWIAAFVAAVTTMVMEGRSDSAFVSEAIPLLAILIMMAAIGAMICVTIRRLHDRNRAWHWFLVLVLLPVLLRAIAGYFDKNGALGPAIGLNVIGVIFGIWGFVELGCLKGTEGPNGFGPDPLAKPEQTAEAFT